MHNFKPVIGKAMAYSAEPGRKAAYSEDLRWRVIWKRLCSEKSYWEI